MPLLLRLLGLQLLKVGGGADRWQARRCRLSTLLASSCSCTLLLALRPLLPLLLALCSRGWRQGRPVVGSASANCRHSSAGSNARLQPHHELNQLAGYQAWSTTGTP